MKSCKLSHSVDKSVSKLLTDKVTMRQWQLLGLPRDVFSADGAVITLYHTEQPLRRWPLLIDPQNIAKYWLQAMPDFEVKQAEHNYTV